MEKVMEIGTKKLYVETAGNPDAPALLYLHGGPGIGCYDFMLMQKERLSKELYLVSFDQRGVLRSEPLTEDESLCLEDLVEDCESVRKKLGIEKWSVLSHSFGGLISLLYSAKYPEVIETSIFECPTFDLGLSARSLIRGAGKEFEKMGDKLQAKACVETADGNYTPQELANLCFNEVLSKLGKKRENLYTYGDDKLFFDRIIADAPFPNEYWGKQGRFQEKLFADGTIFTSYLSLLSSIRSPSLLLKGEHEYVTCDKHLEAFETEVENGKIVFFHASGHMPRFEEPDLYAKQVIEFVTSKGMKSFEEEKKLLL
ncbi:alpha/beta fold hydrolase [Bacillus timonensis]|nr:alpha/beta fold hydrolase [Bacillus timonensis]